MVGHRLSASLVGMFEPSFFLFFSLLMPDAHSVPLHCPGIQHLDTMDPPVIAPGAFGRLQLSRADGVHAAAGCSLLAWGHMVQRGRGAMHAMGLWSGPVQWPGAAMPTGLPCQHRMVQGARRGAQACGE